MTTPIDDQASVSAYVADLQAGLEELATKLYAVPTRKPLEERTALVAAAQEAIAAVYQAFPLAGESDFRQALQSRYETYSKPERESTEAWNRVFFDLEIPRG